MIVARGIKTAVARGAVRAIRTIAARGFRIDAARAIRMIVARGIKTAAARGAVRAIRMIAVRGFRIGAVRAIGMIAVSFKNEGAARLTPAAGTPRSVKRIFTPKEATIEEGFRSHPEMETTPAEAAEAVSRVTLGNAILSGETARRPLIVGRVLHSELPQRTRRRSSFN
jgi:hypothetical protein